MQVKEYLTPVPRGDGSLRPRLQIFSTCQNLIRCLPALQHDPADPGDCATQPHEITHLPDALRYFLRSRVTPPHPPAEEKARDRQIAAYLARHGGKNRKGRFN